VSPRRLLVVVALIAPAACMAMPADDGTGSAALPTGVRSACDHADMPAPALDIDYRVIVDDGDAGEAVFPPSSSSWTLQYQFVVPPLPCSSTWSSKTQTMYLWGDTDFDEFGPLGAYPLSHYGVNQIAPQIMIGNALAGADATYAPSWQASPTWVMQAQYFWQRDDGTNFAQVGPLVAIEPGDAVTTTIAYDAATGAIAASIAAPEGDSAIAIAAPFPNDAAKPFVSWRDFFAAAETAAGRVLGHPMINVETHYTDAQTACSVLPFEITQMDIPNATTSSSFLTTTYGTPALSCPTAFDALEF
jgi:hypothetical protein